VNVLLVLLVLECGVVVPMRYVGGRGILIIALCHGTGMGMQSVFPVPGKKMDDLGFQINAFPEVFGHMTRGAL